MMVSVYVSLHGFDLILKKILASSVEREKTQYGWLNRVYFYFKKCEWKRLNINKESFPPSELNSLQDSEEKQVFPSPSGS